MDIARGQTFVVRGIVHCHSALSYDCQVPLVAVEVLNGKVDGTLAPNLRLLRWVRRHRQKAARPHVIFGLDLHSLEHSRDVWIECQVPALTQQAIVESFRKGRFVSRIASGTVSSSGRIAFLEHLQMLVLRSAYLAWRATLRAVPEAMRGFLIDWSRPLVRVLKRHKTMQESE